VKILFIFHAKVGQRFCYTLIVNAIGHTWA